MNVHGSIIHNGERVGKKVSRSPSMNEQVNKLRDIHVMQYYSIIKRKEVLTAATMWPNLEHKMLLERSQAPKTNIV